MHRNDFVQFESFHLFNGIRKLYSVLTTITTILFHARTAPNATNERNNFCETLAKHRFKHSDYAFQTTDVTDFPVIASHKMCRLLLGP